MDNQVNPVKPNPLKHILMFRRLSTSVTRFNLSLGCGLVAVWSIGVVKDPPRFRSVMSILKPLRRIKGSLGGRCEEGMRLSKVIRSHLATTAPHSREVDSSRSLNVLIAFNPEDALERVKASPFTSFFRISSS